MIKDLLKDPKIILENILDLCILVIIVSIVVLGVVTAGLLCFRFGQFLVDIFNHRWSAY